MTSSHRHQISLYFGAFMMVAAITLTSCGSTGQEVQAPRDTRSSPQSPVRPPPPVSGQPLPTVNLPTPHPPKLSGDPFENKNQRNSPMGTACWGLSELAHMIGSFVVPIVDGKPLYSNEYIRDDSRRKAVTDTLSQVVSIEESVVGKLPRAAQPFVTHLISQGKAASKALQQDSSIDGLLEMHEKISMKYFMFDNYPGMAQFGIAVKASQDCAL